MTTEPTTTATSGTGQTTVTRETITPELAQFLLDHRKNNRTMREGKIRAFAKDMVNGRWHLTGDPVKLNTEGQLIDGEHRLRAVVLANVPVEMFMASDVPDEARIAVDTGTARTLADHFTLTGESYGASLAGAVRVAYSRCKRSDGRLVTDASHQELIEFLDRNPRLRDSVAATNPARVQLRIAHGWSAALHYEMHGISAEDCADFWNKLITGADCPLGHPITTFRKRQMDSVIANAGRAKVEQRVIAAWLIKTWNAYRDGRELHLLRFRPGGANPEDFPELM